jgi:hypothetical protein
VVAYKNESSYTLGFEHHPDLSFLRAILYQLSYGARSIFTPPTIPVGPRSRLQCVNPGVRL